MRELGYLEGNLHLQRSVACYRRSICFHLILEMILPNDGGGGPRGGWQYRPSSLYPKCLGPQAFQISDFFNLGILHKHNEESWG